MGWFSRIFRRQPKMAMIRSAEDLRGMLTAAELKALDFSDIVPVGTKGQAVWSEWNYETAVREGYRSNAWVWICCYRICTALAQPPWYVEEGNDEEGWERYTGHPLAGLINKPNVYEPRDTFMHRIALHLLLHGNAPQFINRADGEARELYALRPDCVAPVKAATGVEKYVVKGAGGIEEPVPAKDIIAQQFADPFNMIVGTGPTEPGGRSIDIDREAQDWIKSSLQNRAVASGVLSVKHRMNDPQFDRFRTMIRSQIEGPDNALGVLLLGSEASWQQLSLTPVDMDYIPGKKMTREEICAVYGVPPTVAGILENATLANLEASWVAFWMNTVIPMLSLTAAWWNFHLAPEYGPGLRLNYDLAQVEALFPLFRAKLDAADKAWRMGVPMKECNRRLGLGFLPYAGWDVSYVQSKYEPAPAEQDGEDDSEDDGDDEQSEKSLADGNGKYL